MLHIATFKVDFENNILSDNHGDIKSKMQPCTGSGPVVLEKTSKIRKKHCTKSEVFH